MSARRRALRILLSLILLGAMSAARSALPPSSPALSYRGDPRILSRGLPNDWTVALQESGWSIPSPESTALRAPEIIVSRDGTIIWLAEDKASRYRSFNPERWRIGKVDPKALDRLSRLIESQRFFSMPADELRSPENQPNHGTLTTVAINFRGKVRVLAAYSVAFQTGGVAAEPFARGYAAIVNAIRDLCPLQNSRYDPDRIKVELFPDHLVKGKAVPWPAARLPDRNWRWPAGYYSGAEAKAIIEALSQSYRVSFREKEYVAGWAPAFSMPRNPELLQPVSAMDTGAPSYTAGSGEK